MRAQRFIAQPRVLAATLLALALALPNASLARAADYTGLANQISKAVDATSGNLMVADLADKGTTEHMEIVTIRRGARSGTYVKVVAKDTTGSHTTEVVATATRMCFREKQTWTCSPTKSGAGLGDVYGAFNNPFKIMATESHVPNGQQIQITAAGGKTVHGQNCIGFTISVNDPKTHISGSAQIWIAAASSLPVEEDVNSVGKSVLKFTAVWSHWNDSSLRLPATPA